MTPISELLSIYREHADEQLSLACQFADGCPERLAAAIRYSLLAPGKRLRPALVMMAAEACGGSRESASPAAVAVEMIHAYSLIHDDLPAMDDDDLRRGRPTTHIEFGEATAILAGDALQAQAYVHLCRSVSDPSIVARLTAELAVASGAAGLVGGQEDDLAAESMSVDQFESPRLAREHLDSIHRRKTGALFVACARMGAISVGANDESTNALGRFAELFGLVFQITDDILDCISTDEQLGKRTQKDIVRGKFTYPSLMASESLAASMVAPSSRSTSVTATSPDSVSVVDDSQAYNLGGALDMNDAVDLDAGIHLARTRAAGLIEEAHETLGLLGPSAQRLHTMADYLLERTS